MEETLTMRNEDIDKLKVIENVLHGKLTWREASQQLGLCVRQIGYWCARVRQEGNRGIIHRLRGRASNHRLDSGLLDKALELVQARYSDFGPTLAREKLEKVHRIKLSTFTLRQHMIRAGIWKPKTRRQKQRARRERRSRLGMLVQLDGSEHDWLEGRGPRCVLLLYVDDATSRILYAEFVRSEDTLTLLRTTRSYLERYGRPVAFYVDKDSIYKVNRQASIEEQLRDCQPSTQFGRAIEELGIELIWAHSPQAKGRVERSFKTHQDRLVKELRLAGISTLEAANAFLWGVYLPDHNARCAVEAAQASDAHRPLLAGHRLEEILSLRSPRTLLKDFTLRFDNQWFQLLPQQPVRLQPNDQLLVEVRLDGSTHLRFKDRYLRFQLLPARPAKPTESGGNRSAVAAAKTARPYRPPPTHPWKAASYQRMLRRKASARLPGAEPRERTVSQPP
jgi:hypothetical protein